MSEATELMNTMAEAVEHIIKIAERSAPPGSLELEEYQLMRRRIIASVRSFALIEVHSIESMPEPGVAGMAAEMGSLLASLNLVREAAQTDDAWAGLREGILSRTQQTPIH